MSERDFIIAADLHRDQRQTQLQQARDERTPDPDPKEPRTCPLRSKEDGICEPSRGTRNFVCTTWRVFDGCGIYIKARKTGEVGPI